jgi:hypothetical protein
MRARTCTLITGAYSDVYADYRDLPGNIHWLQGLRRSEPLYEVSCLTRQTLQYGVTPAQESTVPRPHVPGLSMRLIPESDWPRALLRPHCQHLAGIDTRFIAHRMVIRAALKGRHVSFFQAGHDALRNAC